MPDRLQLAVPCILEETLGLRFFEQYQSFFVDSTLADGDPQMRVRLAKRFRGAQSSTNSFAHLDALVFLRVFLGAKEAGKIDVLELHIHAVL